MSQSGREKKWCGHIKEGILLPKILLIFPYGFGEATGPNDRVADYWQYCPVCGAKRPSKKENKNG